VHGDSGECWKGGGGAEIIWKIKKEKEKNREYQREVWVLLILRGGGFMYCRNIIK
jgi:hypothetical protein